MNQSVNGCVVDETTGEPLTSPDVRLYRIGVAGETCTVLNEHGCFSFSDLLEGEYSLAFYDQNFVPRYERLTLAQGRIMPSLRIALRPGGLLSGRILDDKQQPPERCWFTLNQAGERRGEPGYISDSGDHKVSDDGTFCSPPLSPARYFLRFAGILRKPATVSQTNRVTLLCNSASSIFCIPMLRTSLTRRASTLNSARRSRVCNYRFHLQSGIPFAAK